MHKAADERNTQVYRPVEKWLTRPHTYVVQKPCCKGFICSLVPPLWMQIKASAIHFWQWTFCRSLGNNRIMCFFCQWWQWWGYPKIPHSGRELSERMMQLFPNSIFLKCSSACYVMWFRVYNIMYVSNVQCNARTNPLIDKTVTLTQSSSCTPNTVPNL